MEDDLKSGQGAGSANGSASAASWITFIDGLVEARNQQNEPNSRHPINGELTHDACRAMDETTLDPQLARKEFQSLAEVVQYLKDCRPRKLQTGDWSFEVVRGEDRSGAVRTFFKEHPEHRVSINGAARFITLSERALERINAQLPEGAVQFDPQNPVIMADKYR